MLKPHPRCNVCIQLKDNPKLLKDIYNTSYYMRGSSISLRSLHDDYKVANGNQFSYEALLNHVKKHQFMSEKDFTNRHLRQIANQAEKTLLKRNLEAADVWAQVIEKGSEALANGEMSVKAADLLKAAKDKSDYELKTKDQEIAMMEMVMHFASGENETKDRIKYERRTIIEGATAENDDPADGTSGDSESGEARPSGVYYPPAWDAVTPGTS